MGEEIIIEGMNNSSIVVVDEGQEIVVKVNVKQDNVFDVDRIIINNVDVIGIDLFIRVGNWEIEVKSNYSMN